MSAAVLNRASQVHQWETVIKSLRKTTCLLTGAYLASDLLLICLLRFNRLRSTPII